MAKVIKYMPELQGEEQLYVAQLMKDMTEEQAEHFSHVYRQRRKDATTTLILALAAVVGFAGIHRFHLNQIGLGLLYLLTWGLCGIGTIVDLVQHQKMTFSYNRTQAAEVAALIKGAFPELDTDEPKQLR